MLSVCEITITMYAVKSRPLPIAADQADWVREKSFKGKITAGFRFLTKLSNGKELRKYSRVSNLTQKNLGGGAEFWRAYYPPAVC